VPIEQISPHLIYAVIAAEDSRFCQHIGIDFDALNVALEDNKSGGRRRGGSTLTQQTAKNVFLWNGGGYARKAVEAWFALYIDTVWSKRRIMEVYLNIAEWGDGIFGAEAAAQARFGKPASDLTPREAALLAAVLPSPNKWRVNPPGSYVQGRASTLQQRARVVSQERLASCVMK
jgi:monofunctional biosynthetic peptidoglycan transglycosylase